MPIINETQLESNTFSVENNRLAMRLIENFQKALSSQEISYVDDGTFVIPGTSAASGPDQTDNKQAPAVTQVAGQLGLQTRQFATQEPNATIYIKKKVFSTLRNHFDLKYMGEDEKFFLRASKQLFFNKTNEIAAYERLTKIKKFLNEGIVSQEDFFWMMDHLAVATAIDKQDLKKAVLKIREANIEDEQNTNTKWVIGVNERDISGIGLGAGVIELTLFTNISTSLSLREGDLGSCSVTIEDPYHILFIKAEDIDKAILQTQPAITTGPSKTLFDEAQRIEQEFEAEFKKSITISFNLKTGDIQGPSWDISDNDNELAKEDKKAQELRRKISDYINAAQRYVEEIVDRNKLNNYVRNKMLKFYNGKAIVQPMDTISVFVNSNTTLQSFSEVTPSGADLDVSNYRLEMERQQVLREFSDDVKNKFPIDEYRALRRKDAFYGTQIFYGVVDNVSDSYSANAGKYSLSIKASNNLKWLNISRINKSPTLDQQQGILEDPLTPFIVKPDADGFISSNALELLPENQALLKNHIVSIRGGVFDGRILTPSDFGMSNNKDTSKSKSSNNDTARDKITEVSHVPGLRYRWKEGMYTVTQKFFVNDPGIEFNSRQDMTRLYGLTLSTSPFDNLDAANIVSILVTGYPYNFERFLRNAIDAGNFLLDSTFNGGEDYFSSAFNLIRTQNKTLGNFVPYMLINSNTRDTVEKARITEQINKYKSERQRLDIEIAKLQDQKASLEGTSAENQGRKDRIDTDNAASGDVKKEYLIANINKKIEALTAKRGEAIDKETAEDENKTEAESIPCKYKVETSSLSEEKTEQNIQRSLANFIYKRRSDVKYNRDVNLFIVSNEYDADVDIQAFTFNLKGQSPEIYENNSAYDFPLATCINVAKTLDFEFFADANGHIHFRPPQYNKTPLSILKSMFKSGRVEKKTYPPFLETILFNRQDLASIRISEIIQLLLYNEALLNRAGAEEIINIVNHPDFPQGQIPRGVVIDDNFINEKTNSNLKFVLIRQEIERLEDEEARLEEYVSKIDDQLKKNKIDENLSKLAEDPFINPWAFNAIEFDNINFLGYGSGRRFIINDDVIIQYNFSEGDDGIITRVDVMGRQNLTNTGFGEFGLPQYIWAGGTDFDLWQQYGYRYADSQKPYFQDAETQCRPYAAFLLNRQKRDIIKGSITIVGNEYYQLGDVVYVVDRELLYYVYSVKQNFDYNGTFQTILDLRYGHVPGDYIPTPLDVIGQSVISGTRNSFNFVRESSIQERNERVIGAVVFFKDKYISEGKNIAALVNSFLIAKNYININNEVKLILRSFYTENEESSGSDTAEEAVAKVKGWFETPIDEYGQIIASLEKCKFPLKRKVSGGGDEETIEAQMFEHFAPGGSKDINTETDLLLSPSEEVLSLVEGEGYAIENIVEILISFETNNFREQRNDKYFNKVEIIGSQKAEAENTSLDEALA